jgi:hypothetical protein
LIGQSEDVLNNSHPAVAEILYPIQTLTNLIWLTKREPDDKEKVLLYMGLAEKELARLAEIAQKLTLTAFASDTSQ